MGSGLRLPTQYGAALALGGWEWRRDRGSLRLGALVVGRGAGATFPAPLYQGWLTQLYVGEGLAISCEAGGSGDGLAKLGAGLVDFAGCDRPDPSCPWVQIPITAGSIALAYNHSGCPLRLKRQQVRQIFAGTIRNYS